ncbi:hypothetical protein [Vibrio metschnikovii]|nr:hypothetical protein [Vibrio metschnikovii]
MAFSVARNNTWTNDGKATKAFFEAQGATVKLMFRLKSSARAAL